MQGSSQQVESLLGEETNTRIRQVKQKFVIFTVGETQQMWPTGGYYDTRRGRKKEKRRV
jgi:hypothetical protein